jgi:predicted transcriptional regulator
LFRVATDTKRMRMETKAAVRALLERLPDDCTMDDVLYHLYVLDRIERGLAEADAGRTIPHDQVAEEMRRRWLLGAAE